MAQKTTYDEQQIITQLHSPDTVNAAFAKVMEHYTQPLYWQIRRMVIDHDDANDVLQNTFIKAWTNIHNFRGDAKLSTWLYKIAVNESIDFTRHKNAIGMVSADDDNSNTISSKPTTETSSGTRTP